MIFVQATRGIDATEIARVTRALGPGDRNLPAGTERCTIEHGKQLIRAADVDYRAGRLRAGAVRGGPRWGANLCARRAADGGGQSWGANLCARRAADSGQSWGRSSCARRARGGSEDRNRRRL